MEIAVYSQGSISWTDAHMMSAAQRNKVTKIIVKFNEIKSGKSPTEFL
jgi:hypothetical protein